MGEIVVIGDAPLWVVGYYCVMWLINTHGYALAAYSFYHLSQITRQSKLYLMLARIAVLLFAFAIIRGGSGLFGIYGFWDGAISSTETIEVLGVVSLFLNTTFINAFAVVAFLELRRMQKLRRYQAELFNSTVKAFDNLRTAVNRVQNNTPKSGEIKSA